MNENADDKQGFSGYNMNYLPQEIIEDRMEEEDNLTARKMSEDRLQFQESRSKLVSKPLEDARDSFQVSRPKLLRKTTTIELNIKIPTIDQDEELRLRKTSSMHFDEIQEE